MVEARSVKSTAGKRPAKAAGGEGAHRRNVRCFLPGLALGCSHNRLRTVTSVKRYPLGRRAFAVQHAAPAERLSNHETFTGALWFFYCPARCGGKKWKEKGEITMRMRNALTAGALALTMLLTACGGSSSSGAASASAAASGSVSAAASAVSDAVGESGLEDGVLTVAMECAYAPYNWTQPDDSNGAVPIKDSSDYANGYDVMMAKMIAEELGVELEIVRSDWDSLVPAVQSGTVDAVIAGQSMTAGRSEQVDFAGPYFYASIVCVTKADSPYASATGISDLSGGTCTAQIATIWYDSCLPQIEGAQIQTAAESAPAMLMALETDTVDFICTDMPTPQGPLTAYRNMRILDFTDSDDNFQVDEGEINIGISLRKGNVTLQDAINSVLEGMTADDFNELMAQAISIQPIGE